MLNLFQHLYLSFCIVTKISTRQTLKQVQGDKFAGYYHDEAALPHRRWVLRSTQQAKNLQITQRTTYDFLIYLEFYLGLFRILRWLHNILCFYSPAKLPVLHQPVITKYLLRGYCDIAYLDLIIIRTELSPYHLAIKKMYP